jgi:N-acetylneuraminic acid mutarotase
MESNIKQCIKNVYFYIIGGRERGITLSTVERYSLFENKWESLPSLNEPRGSLAAAYMNNKIYIMGGGGCNCNLNTCEALDINNNTWKSVASLSVARHALTSTINNKLFVIGGWIAGTISAPICESYDADKDKWTTHSQLNIPRRLHGVASHKEYIYVFGGSTAESSEISSVECYNTLTDEWCEVQNMPSVARPVALTIGEYIYLILGGRYILKYSPGRDEYENVENGKLPLFEWYGFSAEEYEGKIYIFGGTTKGKLTKSVYSFDTNIYIWEEVCKMKTVRRRSSIVKVII